MRARFRDTLLVATLATTAACAARKQRLDPPQPAAIEAPERVELQSEEEFRAHQPTAMACMAWLIETHPAAEASTWVRVQDFALDWIENAPFVDAKPRAEVFDRVGKDTRFFYSMYMRTAYLSARTLYWLGHPKGSVVAAELAAIEGMQRLYAVFQSVDPKAKSRGLRKYARLKKRGKLEAFVTKKLAKGGGRK